MDDSQTTRNPLLDFADRWEVSGDCIRCRTYGQPQHVSQAARLGFRHVIPHAGGQG